MVKNKGRDIYTHFYAGELNLDCDRGGNATKQMKPDTSKYQFTTKWLVDERGHWWSVEILGTANFRLSQNLNFMNQISETITQKWRK